MNSGAGAELVRCVKEYFKKMLSESGSGMKVLLVDSETMEIVTAVYTQSEILAKEVFLVEKLELSEEQGESMLHMKAVCFVRPTSDNLAHLKRHLRTPKYGEYHLFFSNMVRDGYLQQLAEADEGELVRQVQEYFADYCALDSSHFTVPVADPSSCFLRPNIHPQVTQHTRDRMVQGIASVLLSLKRRPIIRYQESSENSRSVAGDVYRLVYEQEAALFDFRHSPGSTVLLIIDRLDDPVTPLLSQWTYQAMVHELIGIKGHRVDLRHVPKVPPEQKEVVLNAERDEFFKEHLHANYGDLGLAVKSMVDEFQVTSKSNQNISSIEDMQRFVENYPEFRAKSGNVSKHVAVLSELNRLIDARQLMRVSCTEQELACSSSAPKDHCAEVKTMLEDPAVDQSEKLRLVLLYALRYEKEGMRQLAQLMDVLSQQNVPRDKIALVDGILRAAGAERRTGDLYGTKTFSARASKMVSSLKGVDNVYTQHQPMVMQTIDNLNKGKIKDQDYPFVGQHQPPREKPAEVIVFMVGGTTYEEARAVALHNANAASAQTAALPTVLLGGTCVHNSASFMQGISDLMRESGQLR